MGSFFRPEWKEASLQPEKTVGEKEAVTANCSLNDLLVR